VEPERVRAWGRWLGREDFDRITPDCRACADADLLAARQEADEPSDADSHEGRVLARLAHSGLPRPMWDLRLGDLHTDVDEAIANALASWAREGGGLFLHGPVGTGKTTMAAMATRAALERRNVTFTSVPALVLRYRAAYGTDEQDQATRTLTGTGGLVLDDLGQEPPSEDVRNQLFGAIDTRVAHAAPLLLTSNLSPSELGARYGAWLPSRIQGYCLPLRILGRDRRLDPPTDTEGTP
jgi:DNA replication protein DnaC